MVNPPFNKIEQKVVAQAESLGAKAEELKEIAYDMREDRLASEEQEPGA